MKLVPRSAGYLALLVALGSFGPLTMSIYTPVMPSVGVDLGASAESVKFTLTTYMLGFAVGQLFYGPLSDRYGRRPVLIGSFALYVAACGACAAAPSVNGLILARAFQALGAAGPIILARTVVRDLYEGHRAAREMARMIDGPCWLVPVPTSRSSIGSITPS